MGVVGSGEDRFQGHQACIAVVGVVDVALAHQIAVGVEADHQFGADAADLARHPFANGPRGAQKAIFHAHE
jgi:hypothetical protein